MSNDLVLVIDLDGTLKTDYFHDGPFEGESFTIKSSTRTYNFLPRPHVKEFLEAASKKATLYLGTAAGSSYARQALKLMDIGHYFDRIIAAEDFGKGNVPFLKNCIFIDNDAEMGSLKMGKMPLTASSAPLRQDLWTIDTFAGDKNDRTMLDLIDELENL